MESRIDEDIVALDVDQGACFGFNVTAARVWTLIEQPMRLSEIRFAACPIACATLDLSRMKTLVYDWPAGVWNVPHRMRQYRLALLRGAGSGRFARWASGSNS